MISNDMLKELAARAQSDDPFAQTLLGFLLQNGLTGVANLEAAELWYGQAARQDYLPAQYSLARLFLMQTETANDNEIVREKFDAAKVWLERAANAGYAAAQFAIGSLYHEGSLVNQDTNRALQMINKAADQGFIPALRFLSSVYAHGRDIEPDLDKARQLNKAAAEKGDAGAAYMYGTDLIKHKDKKLSKEGLEWIWKAAEDDNFYANVFIGEMFGQGLHGARKDKFLSKHFLNRAQSIARRP